MKNTIVSVYKNIKSTEMSQISLWNWIKNEKYKEKVLTARTLPKEQKDKIKQQLPCITPSGLFSGKHADTIIRHSGFISFDVDAKDNPGLDMSEAKIIIAQNIPEVCYCGYSFSGAGLWGLIKIANPAKHKEYYSAIIQAVKIFSVQLDASCSNINRLRVYSYDPEPYINLNAPVWYEYFEPTKPKPLILKPEPNARYNDFSRIAACIKQIQLKGVDITGTQPTWFSIGCGIASVLGESGRAYYHAISCFYPRYTARETDAVYSRCLKANGNISTFFYHCKQHNISFL